MADTEQHDRRQCKRIPFIKEVEVLGVGILRCSDLSIGGMYLETVNSFPVGTVFDLKFKLRDADEHSVYVPARVIYKHEGIGVGLCFYHLKLEDRQRIEKFIEQT